MTDATDRAAARNLLTEYLQPSVAPTLLPSEIDDILDRNQRAQTWEVNTAYIYGAVIVPPIRNGRRYRAIVPGTSALVDPGFLFWSGPSVSEGSSNPVLTWVDDGPEYANVFDVRRAAYDGWRLKAEKASQFINTGDLGFTAVYKNCMELAEKFAGVMIA